MPAPIVTTPHPPGPRVGIYPYGKALFRRLADVPLRDLVWPLGRPEGYDAGQVGDLGPEDHVVLYPQLDTILHRAGGTRAQRALYFAEPRAVHGANMWLAEHLPRRFDHVVTYDARLRARLGNTVFCPFGGSWVWDWESLACTKSRPLSLIASAKRSLTGHKMRHSVAAWLGAEGIAADVMGGGYRPFGAKAEGLAPYRFSAVIENARETDYFSEKLIDAFLCLTVPVYWGCPNITDYFDPAGMVICTTEAEMRAALRHTTAQDYARYLPALLANRAAARAYMDCEGNVARALIAASR